MTEGTPVGDHVLRMTGYLNEMEILKGEIDCETQTDIILPSLPKSFEQFCSNYNMNKKLYGLAEILTELQAAESVFHKHVQFYKSAHDHLIMGNCLAINVNIPFEQLFTMCCSQEGVPRRRRRIDLQNDWARLKAARDDILRTIDESPEMRPLEIVNHWLRRVEVLEDQVEILITNHAQESANKCFFSYCPRNCKKSYSLWKQIGRMDQEVLDLYSQVLGVAVERPRIAPALRVPAEPTTGMQLMLDEIWSHVGDEQYHLGRLIGLYGMGGVGKTTLLKAVNNKLCSSTQNFDLQFWIVVSKTPNLIDIQNHIGEKIGFHGGDWGKKSLEGKSTDIYNVLCKKKYILLLDDIWERFDLTKIGIPLPNLHNKSKIIFTTRSEHLCGQMEATPIQIRCLNDEEAWNLFKKSVGEKTLNAHRDIDTLARVVMRECNGLPLALIVIGRAMTLKRTIYDWKHAINVLQSYTAEFSTISEEVFIPLKYSYDNLTNDAIRSCFLYCSLYAEDQEISKSNLVDKWICEGFLSRFHDLDKHRNEGYSYISTLVHASLLEECSHEMVKMHDVIRDMALWIAGDSFYVKARAGLSEVPNDVKWGHVEKLSLMGNSIKELNNGPIEVTNLKTILFDRGGFSSINNDFWKFVPNLKVLDLSYNRELTSLPEEFCELVFLQYLNLSMTKLKELPNEFQKLVRLKYLNVEHTEISTIPEGVLSSMKELSVFRCGNHRNTTCYDFLGENLVKEFDGLKCLQEVEIPATSKVEISNLMSSINFLNCITMLILTSFSDSKSLDILFLKGMKHLQILSIRNLEQVDKIVVGEGQNFEISTIGNENGFTSLRYIKVYECSHLTNLSWLVFFPNIEYIDVFRCEKMQTLVSENEYKLVNEVEPFAKLQTLQLLGVPKLESIYFTSLPFPCLNGLYVSDCHNLKKLPFNSTSFDQGHGITIIGPNKWWNELQWEDEATRTTFSSYFESW